jgi:hypothetical protein
MNLTPDQKKAVTTWIGAGASISDVQKRLRDEFNLSLTYIDTRFLIDDLGLDIKKAPPPKTASNADLGASKPATPRPPAGGAPGKPPPVDANAELVDEGDAYAAGADEFEDDLPPEPSPAAGEGGVGGGVTVDIDRITRPGTVVSGTVKFSDGQSGKWALDQLGRLVFEGSTPGYRPSQPDLQAFQRALSAQLQKHGY